MIINVVDVILIMQIMTVSIIWIYYVVQNSYLKAQRQVDIFIRGGMLIRVGISLLLFWGVCLLGRAEYTALTLHMGVYWI